jgi:sugar phosphate isomerase/epimerase
MHTCDLAERLQLKRLTLLAGLPGGGPRERTPNWIVHPFPSELESMLRWQWDECILPHWQSAARIASDHGLQLCFEMVPADCVYHPSALLRLRTSLGPVIGCNFDPSHLFMQGIDPIEAIQVLGDTIYHVHAKDARLEPSVVRVNGVLDTLPYSAVRERAWIYRTVGYGHGEDFWRDFVSALRGVGYDDVVSIEHEDALFAADEGLRKAVEVLQRVVPFAPLDDAGWWAVDADG